MMMTSIVYWNNTCQFGQFSLLNDLNLFQLIHHINIVALLLLLLFIIFIFYLYIFIFSFTTTLLLFTRNNPFSCALCSIAKIFFLFDDKIELNSIFQCNVHRFPFDAIIFQSRHPANGKMPFAFTHWTRTLHIAAKCLGQKMLCQWYHALNTATCVFSSFIWKKFHDALLLYTAAEEMKNLRACAMCNA